MKGRGITTTYRQDTKQKTPDRDVDVKGGVFLGCRSRVKNAPCGTPPRITLISPWEGLYQEGGGGMSKRMSKIASMIVRIVNAVARLIEAIANLIDVISS